ncbi:MAG: amidophosphoribosyltransferase [Candidatus Eutrophobiaceae bacterium]
MCGVIGIVADNPVNQSLHDGLTMLQHRGQDAAGIMTSENGRFYLRKQNGMVRDVFHSDKHMEVLRGNMGIGHVRYPTVGCASHFEAQPFYVNSPYGIALAHNGNLTNSEELHQKLTQENFRHINTSSDSELLLNILAYELQGAGKPKADMTPAEIFAAIGRLHERCRGGYAVVAMISGLGIVGFRDPNGVRPIAFGIRGQSEYIIASESVAIQALGFKLLRDIAPGEAIFISEQGELHASQCARNPRQRPCIFEYVYLARPDSILDGVSVYRARLGMGVTLAKKIQKTYPNHDIDVVIPIPDSSRPAALPLANALDLPYREGFIKNRYIPRTFIMPGQVNRKRSVRQKLNPIASEFKGRNVLLVDDSIVRGTTSREIVQMARDSGALKVYFASAAPPVRYPNVYGIDMPSCHEFIAHGRNVEEVAREIGVDWLVYQDLPDLISAISAGNPELSSFDTSCFTGEYVTEDVDEDYLRRISQNRNASDASESDALTDLAGNEASFGNH